MPPFRTKTIRPVLNCLAPRLHATADADALRRFHRYRDEDAFAQLVRHHSPLVLGVCRRVLGARAEVDDAAQATFWTLARKAGTIRDARTLPAWLHAVAYRTARKTARHLAPPLPDQLAAMAPDDPLAEASWREVRQLLDEEVHRLPHRLRLPILLCYFEDLTRDEAADRLGWSISTVKRRLDVARQRLKARLLRRGVAPGLVGATALLTGRLTARVSATLETACARLASQRPAVSIRMLATAPPAAATGKWLVAVAAVAGLGWGFATIAGQGPASDPKSPSVEAKEKDVSPKSGEVNEPLPPAALVRFGTTRYRANTAFWFGSFSKDGRWLVSGTEGVELWDMETGLSRQLAPVRNNTVPRPRLSPDGSVVAVLDGGPGIHLFDRESGKELRTVGAGQKFDDCRFSPDSKRVLGTTYGATPVAKGFDVANGDEAFAHVFESSFDYLFGVWDGRNIIVLLEAAPPAVGAPSQPLKLRVLDAATGKELRAIETVVTDYQDHRASGGRGGFRDPPGSTFGGNWFALADDLSHLAYLRTDGTPVIVGLKPGSKPRAIEQTAAGAAGRQFHPSRFWFAPDGKSLFMSDHSGGFARCDTATGKVLATFPGHRNGVGYWHFDPAGKVLTTAGQDGLIRRWDLTSNREIPLAPGFRTAVKAVFSADGTLTVVGDKAGTLEIYAVKTGKRMHEVPRPKEAADWCTFAQSPDGRTLAATRPDGTILWWDVVAGKEIATEPIAGPKPDQVWNSIDAMTFSADSRRLACGHPNGGLSVIDTATHKELWQVGLPAGLPAANYAIGVAFSADGRHVARGLRDWDQASGRLAYTIQVVDSFTGREVKTGVVTDGKVDKGDTSEMADLRYTSDGHYLAVLSRNGKVQLLHAETLVEVSTWMTGSRDQLALGISPEGRTLMTGDENGAIKLWEIVSGKVLANIPGHRGHIASTAISSDGRLLLTGGHDQVAYVWNLKPEPVARPGRPIDRLIGDNAEQAREAVWAIAADPDGPKLLREQCPPADGPKPETIQGWIADLDSPMFARREAATAALTKAGSLAEPAMWRALQGKPTAEVRERLEKVLASITRRPTREDIHHSRAVQAMELAGSEAAIKVLKEWAAGAEGAWLTVDARAALQRLRAQAPAR